MMGTMIEVRVRRVRRELEVPADEPCRSWRSGSWRALLAGILALWLCLPPGCAVNPVSGRREVILMSEEREREIDRQEAKAVEEQLGLVADPAINAYIDAIGQELASHSPRKGVEYHFAVVEMDEPNAFALPGGHVYVSRGLLLTANSEAEVANVIGHEIGHVAARHAAQRDVNQKVVGIATLLGTIGAVMAGGSGPTAASVSALGQGTMAAFSRKQERQADRIGEDLTVNAGIDPTAMARFLRSLDNTTRLSQGFSRPPGYLDTHPATPERIAEAATSAARRKWQPKFALAQTRVDYLKKIEGLSVGRPAAEGVLRDDRFLHADLGISLRFPYGWSVHNQSSQVIGLSKKADAFALLELHGKGDDPEVAAMEFVRRENLKLQSSTPVRVGDLRAHRIRAATSSSFGSATVEITWIVHGGNIFRLSAGAPVSAFRSHEGTFRSFARSFRRIRPAELAAIDELRLRLAEVQVGEGLDVLSRRTANEWDLNTTAVMNGIQIGDPLEPGFLVKVAVREPYRPDAAEGREDTAPLGPAQEQEGQQERNEP
jgi:predicted Zn-dependent protease